MKLDEHQLKQFKLFGFVVLKNILTKQEIKILQTEFETAVKQNEEKEGHYDGTSARNMSMLGKNTPLYSSLIEDLRFYDPVRQIFGEKSFGFEVNSYRYSTSTKWHFNDGSPNIYGYGAKYQFPIFEPVTAQSGALRFIPGSHKDPWQSELKQWWPLSAEDSKEGLEIIPNIPYFPAECELGDAVLFDLRIMHATWGGYKDRKVSCISYYHYPESPKEFDTMKRIIPGFWNKKDRWNKEEFDYFFSNPNKSSIIKQWINSYNELYQLCD